MKKRALDNLRESMRKGAAWGAGTAFSPGSTQTVGPIKGLLSTLGLGRDYSRLALYNQAQALKAQQVSKELAKYKGMGKITGGALGGILALMLLSGKNPFGGGRQEVQPPTMVRYG